MRNVRLVTRARVKAETRERSRLPRPPSSVVSNKAYLHPSSLPLSLSSLCLSNHNSEEASNPTKPHSRFLTGAFEESSMKRPFHRSMAFALRRDGSHPVSHPMDDRIWEAEDLSSITTAESIN